MLIPDSACLAVSYTDKEARLILGVYYVLRVQGCDKSALGVFARQGEVFALFAEGEADPSAGALLDVQRHWVGKEHSLCAFLQAPGSLAVLPFAADHMMRLETVDKQASADAEHELLLLPLATGAPAGLPEPQERA